MSDIKNIVAAVKDSLHGKMEKYSSEQTKDLLRSAIRDINGGSDKLSYKTFANGRSNGLFELIEDILSDEIVTGLQSNDFFMNLVDTRNIKAGDKNLFTYEDGTLFQVSEVAGGTQGIRRQRIGSNKTYSVDTTWKACKIYDEIERLLAGVIDFPTLIDKVGKSFLERLLGDAYNLIATATADTLGGSEFAYSGSYTKETMLELVEYVEAASGGLKATIVGTGSAVRNLAPDTQGNVSLTDLYNMGYYGNFYGTPVAKLNQRFKPGTKDFVFDNNKLFVIAGGVKPIKCVYEGESIINYGNFLDNGDLTQEYLYMEKYGMGFALPSNNGGIGTYTITA
jgi:hypothetical protein